jgi:glycosyltransferase involved in cell wall biosynthesis
MKFSIVMPSFNQAKFVDAALQSVFTQDYSDWELLFIDGGSTDGTMNIIEKYRDRLAYCISEPDKGQSDAFRKGFSRATGDVFTWLNTDDLLLPGVLSQVAKTLARKPQKSWLLGNVVWIDKDDRILKCWRGEGHTPGWMRLGLFAAGGPSAFFRRELYERVGGVNLDLHYQMDTDLWWRFAMAGESFSRLPSYTWALRLHEDAKTSGHMFVSTSDAKQKIVLQVKNREHQHIQRQTAVYRRYYSPLFSPVLSILRKITSPSFLRGCFDNVIYKRRKLSDLVPIRVSE